MTSLYPDARAWRALAGVLAVGLLIGPVLGGCTPTTRYSVLTVFFTGVPPPGSKPAEETPLAVAPQPTVARRTVVVKASQYSHGPFATNQCFLCHQTSASGGLRGFGKQQAAQGSLAKSGAVSGQLVAPLGELCIGCHVDAAPEAALAAGQWVHGPVTTGNCTLCHSAHAAPEPFLLRQAADALCTSCHADGLLAESEAHASRGDCLGCHDPHWGGDRRLLKVAREEGA